MSLKLSEFPHGTAPRPVETSSRVTAGLLTALVYAAVAVLLLTVSLAPRTSPPQESIMTAMVSARERPVVVDPVPPVPDEKILPRTEKPAPPVVTIDSGVPPTAPAPLPATTAESPMIGGTSGNGPMGQAASGNGTDGNGGGSGGCLDPVWMRQVSERVRQFFYYPGPALASRTTGVVTIRFGVRRDGRIDKLEVARSSGNDGLDKAAADILQKAQPLPPIPARMQRDRVEGELPINFGVRNFSGTSDAGNCRGV